MRLGVFARGNEFRSFMAGQKVQRETAIRQVVIFANPIAGRGRSRAATVALRKKLRAAGIRAELHLEPPNEAPAELLEQCDAVISIGGDGTLRAVARRCIETIARVPPLLPVPTGTANLMGKHLGIAWSDKQLAARVVQSLQRAQLRYVDAPRVNGELFLLMIGVGIDAQIVHETSRNRKGNIGYVDYLLPAVTTVWQYRFSPMRVSVDGKKVFGAAPAAAFVANIPEYGIGFPILPDARSDDGLLDVCVIPVGSYAEMVLQFVRAAAGVHLDATGTVQTRGREILIEADEPIPVQADGDPAGFTPVRIDLLPIRVPFIVPV